MYTCRCGDVFEDGESIGIDYGMCQMCWEHYCATRWFDALAALAQENANQTQSDAKENAKP